jgi:transcriptional regulator with XRE-family HTH domain
MPKTAPYNPGTVFEFEEITMPKRKDATTGGFSARLAELRKAAGFTQQDLANAIGVSRRMIAYYEVQTDHPPTTLLPAIAEALAVTTDELLGSAPVKKRAPPKDARLQRRLQQIEKLDPSEQRHVLQVLDAFIERGQLKRKMESRSTSG